MTFYEVAERAFAMERAGKPLVKLNIGDTNLPTPECAIRAAEAALARRRSTYGPAAGLPALRERIARREGCAMENVVVGPGSKQLLFGLMSLLGSRGERVALPAPSWPAYELIASHLGMEPVILPASLESGWAFDPEQVRGCKLVTLCNPLNPTSTVYASGIVERAIEVAHSQRGYVLLDEAYRGLAFDPMPQFEGAIRVRSFSKEFNMEGWRLGYAVAPADIARELARFVQISTTCVADFVQEAGAACLDEEAKILSENVRVWRERSEAGRRALAEAGFRFARPQAGMYVFATHDRLQNSGEVAMRLLDRGVAVAPGSGFGDFPRFVRICVNQEPPVLERAIAQLAEALAAERR